MVDTKLKELYNSVSKDINKTEEVYDIFKDFFGEEFVDLQYPTYEEFKEELFNTKICLLHDYFGIDGRNLTLKEVGETQVLRHINCICVDRVKSYILPRILVWFPKVKVSNENNDFTYVYDLYAKIIIAEEGKMFNSFMLNKTTYTLDQWNYNYLHSHVPSTDKEHLSTFSFPCLGVGPIRHTTSLLNVEFNADKWNLFCLELNNYVRTESLKGGPYKRLINIQGDSKLFENFKYTNIKIDKYLIPFVDYFIHNTKLPFCYKNNSYKLGISFIDYIILISNSFIEWFNNRYCAENITYSRLLSHSIIVNVNIKNNAIYHLNPYNDNPSTYVGTPLFKFKGNIKKLNIFKSETAYNSVTILSPTIACAILTKILNTINYKYGREESKETLID